MSTFLDQVMAGSKHQPSRRGLKDTQPPAIEAFKEEERQSAQAGNQGCQAGSQQNGPDICRHDRELYHQDHFAFLSTKIIPDQRSGIDFQAKI